MVKFERFDSAKQLQGLAEAARQIQIEELTRDHDQDISFPFGANAPSSGQDATGTESDERT